MNKATHFLLIIRNTLLKKRNLVFRKSRYELRFELNVGHKLAQVELNKIALLSQATDMCTNFRELLHFKNAYLSSKDFFKPRVDEKPSALTLQRDIFSAPRWQSSDNQTPLGQRH